MYKNWLIGILAALVVVAGYLAYTGLTAARTLRQELRTARSRVQELSKTRPAGATPAPAEQSRAGTQKDPAGAEGCSGCHKKVAPDKDYTIPAELKQIKNHPQPPANAAYPKWCTGCHKDGAPLGSLAQVLHKPHLTGDTYKKEFDTNCLGCHAVVNGLPVAKGLSS